MKKIKESRKFERINQGIQTQCNTYYVEDKLIEANPPIDLLMMNISEGGIGLVSHEKLPVDSVLILNVDFGLETYKIMAKVVWSKKNENEFKSGLEFVSIPYALKEALSLYKNLN
ncbi:c-di-GMP-binding flagellar brake protein YcgR [Acetoanaerobium pronyense]|uniref:C-di-GMP-binding flagellar brake protein YcgR n=1 Tax=Acetoanaerobium pronyense TaxID=1482736 RepID=A0ABS4KKL4_9FIRM|nr:PilZ domain-containing protein [Acetoanaerobium pronyense]MBP2028295.1 c-di-GMP-binding flagellar brake protein YcgR [Acetoanaerobium pronyense]